MNISYLGMTFSSLKKLMEPAERNSTSNVLSLWKNRVGEKEEGGGMYRHMVLAYVTAFSHSQFSQY